MAVLATSSFQLFWSESRPSVIWGMPSIPLVMITGVVMFPQILR